MTVEGQSTSASFGLLNVTPIQAKNESFPFWVNFVAGGTALATSFAIMHPLDTYKTLLQSKQAYKVNVSMQRLTKGWLTSALPAFPQGGLRLATYQIFKERNWPSVAAIVLADLASSMIKVPRELITSRLQTNPHQSILSMTKMILKQEGPLGLFRGFWTTSARDWPFMIILFEAYETCQHFHAQSIDDYHDVSRVLYGGLSGALAAFITTPFDVLRTKLMTNAGGTLDLRPLMRKVVSDYHQQHVNKSKLRPFFVGGLSRSVWWFCVCGMFFPIYEYCQIGLNKV